MSATQNTHRLDAENGSIAIYVRRAAAPASGTIICVHGGPNGDYRGNEYIFEELGTYAPDLGFNIIQFDMFGAGASDGEQADITLKSQLCDYRAVFDYATQEFGQPIHVAGESMGATIAALAWDLPVASYLLLWPAFDLRDTDLRLYLEPEWRDRADRDGLIDDDGTILGRAFLNELLTFDFDPCFQLPSCPCLLVHGKRDMAVPFRQSLDAVRAAHGEAVLFAHPEGDHGLQAPAERDFTHRAIRWWLEHQLS